MSSAILELSKSSWRQGGILSKLDRDTRTLNSRVRELAGELKSLGSICDIVYAELEELALKSETESSLLYGLDDKLWACLATQVEETSQAIQVLEHVLKDFRAEHISYNSQAQFQTGLDISQTDTASIRTQLRRHTEHLKTTHLLIKT